VRSIVVLVGCAGFASLPLAAQDHWRLTEEVRIGSVDEGPASFGDVRGIATNAKGWTFVLDFSTQDVRVFDAQGRHLKTVGRKGSGPGEFQNANGIARAPDGTLWLNDPANARFTALDSDGAFISSFPVGSAGYGFLWVGGVDRAGRLFDEIYLPNAAGYRTALRRFSVDRKQVDTLSLPDCADPARPTPQLYVIKSNNMEAHITVPFTAGPVTAIDPAGYAWCGMNDGYLITKTALGRDAPVAVVRRAAEPLPVTRQDREKALAPNRERFPGAVFDESRIPKVKPLIERLVVDDRSRLWVKRTTADGHTQFDVFGPDGKAVAVVDSPLHLDGWGPLRIEGDRFYGIARNEDDVPFVVRLRVARVP
jgi:hypothetical protein